MIDCGAKIELRHHIASMATTLSQQPPLPVLDSKSEAPALFDGTSRLYINLTCPYSQRTWTARNYKGLDHVELVAINIMDKPKWYLEKVYPTGKVPSLEHNGKVTGESLDLLEYIDKNFEGPRIFPEDPVKKTAAEELLKFTAEFGSQFLKLLRNKEATKADASDAVGPVLDHLETALGKFSNEGPYFLGEISAVDFAYAPFVWRFDLLSKELLDYDIFEGHRHLAQWFDTVDNLDAFQATKVDPIQVTNRLKKILGRL